MTTITYEALKAKAEGYAAPRPITMDEEAAIRVLLNGRYVEGFLQGYTCAGGIVRHPELDQAAEGK